MKTDDLIVMLARQAGPAPRALAARRLTLALAAGGLLGLVGALGLLGPVPPPLFEQPGMWLKLGYAAALAAAGSAWLARLGSPGAKVAAPGVAVVAVIVLMALAGTLTLLATPAGERVAALLGHSWARCPAFVLGLSLPTLAGSIWALRGLAPTRPRQAGLAAGLLAGAVGALSYAFACDELSPAFVALWYSAGIGLSAGLGALAGPRLLRW